jgi:hypothetical protein
MNVMMKLTICELVVGVMFATRRGFNMVWRSRSTGGNGMGEG